MPKGRRDVKRLAAAPVPWQTLQDDVVVHIGRNCGAAELLALGASCNAWRAALGAAEEDLWRALALRDFHRLRAILALCAPPASYLQLYREQYAADASSPDDKSAHKTTLSDFIFSIECHGLPFAACPGVVSTGKTMAWTGKLTEVTRTIPATWDDHMVCADGNVPRLPLESDALFPETLDPRFSDTKMTVYATHQLKTVKLCEATVDWDRIEGGVNENEDDPPSTLFFEDSTLPRRYGQHELWADDEIPDAEPMLGLSLCVAGGRRGELGINFIQDELNFGDMNTEQVHGYLEHMVPWP